MARTAVAGARATLAGGACYHLGLGVVKRGVVSMEEIVIEWMEDEDEEETEKELSYISGSGEGIMDEGAVTSGRARRDEDIALDLMKFVAMTTGYGRTSSTGVGFQGAGSAAKPEEYASHLLELYGKCRAAVAGNK